MLAAIKNQLPIQCRGSYFSRSFIQFSLNCSVEKMRSLSLAKLSPAPPLAALLLLPAAALQPGRRLTTRRLMVDSSPSASTSVECESSSCECESSPEPAPEACSVSSTS